MKICKDCNKEFNKPSKGRICAKCKYIKYNKNYTSSSLCKEKSKAVREYNKNSILDRKECIRWISQCYDRKFMIDLQGISQLILVYDSLGGTQQDLDELKSGEQLHQMWLYCYSIFLEEYKKIIEIDL